MAWSLLDSGTGGFADGSGAGHVYSYPAGAPASGDLLVLCVASDTTVTTPSGWSLPTSDVHQQGDYLYYKVAGGSEPGSATIVTNGNNNTTVGFLRYSGQATASPLDATATPGVATGSEDTSSVAINTGNLAATNELVIAFEGNHHMDVTPTNPVWSSGYTGRCSGFYGTLGVATQVFVGDKRTAGTAAETPSVSWTDTAFDRTMLCVTFKQATGSVSGPNYGATGTDLGGGTGSWTNPSYAALGTGEPSDTYAVWTVP